MFRTKRTDERTRGQLLRAELGESWDHALRAAGHAAGGVRSTVGPRVAPAAARARSAATHGWGSTREAFAPLGEAAHQQINQTKGMTMQARSKAKRIAKSKATKVRDKTRRHQTGSRRRWPKVAGLLAGGAVLGGSAAYVLRRRRQQQWDDYDPTAATEQARAAAGARNDGVPAAAGQPVEERAKSDNSRF